MQSWINLPRRKSKPRVSGITVALDKGLALSQFEDCIDSHHPYIDFVKFGWGTSVVTTNLQKKIAKLREKNVSFHFGGTLFEKAYSQNKVEEYFAFCHDMGVEWVEISNGVVDMSNTEKCKYISMAAKEFKVVSEVGFKESQRSLELHPSQWVEYIEQDLAAGSWKVITESRESGTSGICRPNGDVRYDLVQDILECVDANKIIFEAPSKAMQTYFIKLVGGQVNLANIPFEEIIPLETLRLGLRSDTLLSEPYELPVA